MNQRTSDCVYFTTKDGRDCATAYNGFETQERKHSRLNVSRLNIFSNGAIMCKYGHHYIDLIVDGSLGPVTSPSVKAYGGMSLTI